MSNEEGKFYNPAPEEALAGCVPPTETPEEYFYKEVEEETKEGFDNAFFRVDGVEYSAGHWGEHYVIFWNDNNVVYTEVRYPDHYFYYPDFDSMMDAHVLLNGQSLREALKTIEWKDFHYHD